MHGSRPRIGIAGQLPPPLGGQNLAIAALWKDLRARSDIDSVFCPFQFTPTTGQVRRATWHKAWELLKVRNRLVQIKKEGGLDVLLFPVGGPQTIPLIRDLFLVPWAREACRCFAIQFHAAGLAERMKNRPTWLAKRVSQLLGQADVAFIMAEANRADPEVCGISDIRVRPHQIPDQTTPSTLSKERSGLLYVGHLGDEKGTPGLIQAMASVPQEFSLTLVGDPLPPWSLEKFQDLAKQYGVSKRVNIMGSYAPEELGALYSSAALFVFPSVAPYESFGLVLAEAMMWGLPIVATDWKANREVVGPGENFIFTPGRTENLSKAIVTAAKERERWPIIGSQNRQRYVSQYKLGTNLTLVEDLIRIAKS
jgi:glycosyltransferase involved in cell wall biosynthesis